MVDNILLLANEHEATLKDYGISNAMIRDLTTSLEDFEEISGKPRATTVRHGVTVSEITDLVKAATNLLNDKLDKHMSRCQLTNAPFYRL